MFRNVSVLCCAYLWGMGHGADLFSLQLQKLCGLPRWALVVKNPSATQETWVRPLGLEDALAAHSSILAWEMP